jgi:hypothetical protein
VWSCTRDEGRPLGAGDQEQAPNHRKLLPLRAVVASVAETAGRDPVRYDPAETSASEPLMTCRKSIDGVETGIGVGPAISASGALETGSRGTRLGGGVTPDQALVRNVGTCRPDAKGDIQVGDPGEDLSTNAGHRGGAARSRVEGAVMALDRRGCGILRWHVVNR